VMVSINLRLGRITRESCGRIRRAKISGNRYLQEAEKGGRRRKRGRGAECQDGS